MDFFMSILIFIKYNTAAFTFNQTIVHFSLCRKLSLFNFFIAYSLTLSMSEKKLQKEVTLTA